MVEKCHNINKNNNNSVNPGIFRRTMDVKKGKGYIRDREGEIYLEKKERRKGQKDQ